MITAKQQMRGVELDTWKQSLKEWEDMANDPKFKRLQDKEYSKSRVSRLEALKSQVAMTMASYAADETSEFEQSLMDSYTDTYYRTIYESQNQTGVTANFARLNDKGLREVISKPWQGSNFSKRLWGTYTKELPQMLTESLTRGIALGYGVDRLVKQARVIGNNFTAYQLHRLFNTELAHTTEQATLSGYKESRVAQYVLISTLESHTCERCADLDNGKPIDIDKATTGVNYPPLHPNCRCTTGAYIAELEDDDVDWDAYQPKSFDEWADEVELFDKHDEFVKPEALDKWKLAKSKEKYYNLNGKARKRADERLARIGDIKNLSLTTEEKADLYTMLGATEKTVKQWAENFKALNKEDIFYYFGIAKAPTSKQLFKSIDITTATPDDIIKLGQSVNNENKISEKIGKKEALKAVFSKYRPMGGKVPAENWFKGSSVDIKKRLNNAFSYYPKEWAALPQKNDKKLFAGKHAERGFFAHEITDAKLMYYRKGARPGDGVEIYTTGLRATTEFHEIGHMVEYFNKDALRLSKEFLRKRTVGETPEKLKDILKDRRYKDSETTLKDNFISPYIGKNYPDASEVLSMGLESRFEPGDGHLHSVDKNMVKKKRTILEDEEYLNFIIGLILKG
ncbi:minor capsid protein [Pseudolactococcus insecticola]|uniref:Phage head morphogenesis domain-containing protein n=1 Tax=Pseudolactococcus insecticola TaxID=2709158 RepID=A0A6A0B2T0_9LACT|nr:minor capsid protein [Lactococcus insecticola]GFH39619.1 hypothetical protein Hs20B_00170 [Lactococcus insecticola]